MNAVVEHLTASLHDTGCAMDARAATMRDAWVIRVIRFGTTPIIAACVLLMMQLYVRVGLHWTWGWSGALFNSVISAICLGLTFGTWFTHRWRPIAFTLLSLILASNTVIGTVGGEPMLLYIASMLLVLGSGSLLPWSTRYQLAFNGLVLLSWGTEMRYDGSLDPIALYHCAGLVTAVALSHFTCYVRDRFVKEHEESSKRVRESEAALRQIFDANTGSILLTDLATRRILDVNNRFVNISGYQREELLGKTVYELSAWIDPEAEKEFFRQLLSTGEVKNLEAGFRTKSGSVLPCLISSAIIELNGRQCLITAARDITELKQSQERLRESEQRFRAMFESTRDAIMIARMSDWKLVEVNDQFLAQTCVTREQVIGKTPHELNLWARSDEKEAFLKEFREKGYVESFEMSKRLGDGRTIPVLVSGVKVKLSGEDYYFGMSRDISALRAAEHKVRDSEATLRRIFDASVDWMSIVDMTTGDYLDINESFVDACGLSREEIVGSNFFKLGLWPDEHEWQPFVEELVMRGEVKNARATLRLKDDVLVPCLISAVVRELWGKSCCVSSVRDISALNDAQEKLRRSEETFRKLFDTNRDAVSISDAATQQFIDVNPEFLRNSGYAREEVIGRCSIELGLWENVERQEAFHRSLQRAGEVRNFPADFRRKDGSYGSCLISAVLAEIEGRLCILSMTRDISDLTAAQEKLRRSERTFRQIFDTNRDAVTITDAVTRKLVDVNPEFLRASGYSREEAIGRSAEELQVWTDAEQHQSFRRTLQETGEVRNLPVHFRTKQGELISCLVSAVLAEIDGRLCALSMIRDISELTAAEEKVRKSEAMMRAIFDNSLDSIALTDCVSQNIIEVNAEFCRSIGLPREELVAQPIDKLLPPADPARQAELVRMLMEGRQVRNFEISFADRKGRVFPALVSAAILMIEGRPCTLSVTHDISDIVAAEEKVRKSEAMLRAIFDNTRDGMSLLDGRTQTIIEVNAGLCRITGFAREEMIGRTFEDLMPSADPVRQEELRRQAISGLDVHDFAMTLRDRRGRTFPGLISTARFEFEGRPCTMAVARDISDLAAAEEKVRKSEVMLRAIFDNSLDNVALFDLTDQTIIEVNKELTKTIGYRREDMIGKRMDDLVPRGDPVKQGQFFEMLMQGREVRNWEMNVTSRAGQRTFPALVSACIVEIDGRRCGLTAARDISDLVRAREAALAASRAKSEFLSIMSHEIRTPMNAILGMADLMGESDLNSEQRRYLDTILANGNALLELINSILDLAKVESGRLNLEAVEFDVIELTERAADTLAVRAHEKGVELAVRFAPDLPAMLTGDPHRLRQILTNLIGNAIKFTRKGEVVVSVEPNADPMRPGNFLFSVRDTGIGIAADKIDNIFSIFTQADTSTTRKFGGSGLGLAIVERLAGLMGGRVWVQSELGRGSTFYFTANLKISPTPASKPLCIEDQRMRDMSVLVMGENATSRSIVADLMRDKGCFVAEADCESAARDILTSAARHRTPIGLIFGDLEMKAGDGCEVLAGMHTLAPDAALVMLTNAYGLPAKLRRMRERHLRHYCTRPIKRQEFYSVCTEAFAKSAGVKTVAHAQPAAATSPAPSGLSNRPLKILLADDSPDNRLLIRAYTKKTPYQLTEAENGQIAVDRFIGGGFDLVLMDIQMPVLDGYSAVRAIRKWEAEKGHPHTPIIALTASALEEDVRRAKAAGCDLHVSKPVKKSTLLESVVRVMEEVAAPLASDDDGGNGEVPPIALAAIAPIQPLPPRADFQI